MLEETVFYAAKNLVAPDVIEMVKPWEYDASKAPWDKPKAAFNEYMSQPTANHRYLSLCEGVMPGVKVTEENPVASVAGIIVDYDGVTPGAFEDIARGYLKKAPSGYLPSWAAESRGGKIHMVWLFEVPFLVSDTNHAKRLLKMVLKKINAEMWGAGLDAKAALDPSVYIDIGKQWIPMQEEYRIPASVIAMWDVQMYNQLIKNNRSSFGPEIPMEDLEKEAKKRGFRGMPVPFEAGRHCRRFWDPESDNDRGCTMTEAGVRVFVPHNKPFMSWYDIFKKAFVEKYEAEKFKVSGGGLWWDGSSFWMKESDSIFRTQQLTDLTRKLKCRGISSSIPRNETASELDKFLCQGQDVNRVASAECWMYHKPGIMYRENGEKVLNVSHIEVVQPSAPMTKEGAHWYSTSTQMAFPFLHGLITHLFKGDIPGCSEDDPSQIDRFLWWLAHYYKCAKNLTPEPGQALFIAGNTGTGKSYLSRHILPTLMGGVSVDAGQHLTGGDKWTSHLVGKPFLNIDDDANINNTTRAKYGQILKKLVANAELENQQKFKDATSVPWCGRILVTCNLDQQSLNIIPDMSRSNKDKITLLLSQANCEYRGFKSFGYNREQTRSELPAFARYIEELKIPQQYWDPYKRFGVKAWQHPALLQHIESIDWVTTLIENMSMIFESSAADAKALRDKGCKDAEKMYFTGTSSQLFKLLCDNNYAFAREYTSTQALGRNLTRLSDLGWDCRKEYIPGTKTRVWVVAYDLISQGVDKARASDTGGNL